MCGKSVCRAGKNIFLLSLQSEVSGHSQKVSEEIGFLMGSVSKLPFHFHSAC